MKHLVWVDLETTGLDPDEDDIFEIGVIVTTPNLEIVDKFAQVIHQPIVSFDKMNEWVQSQHQKSLLLEDVKVSQITIKDAEQSALRFVQGYAPFKEAPMCGSTISFDRSFLRVHMPELENYFHYRNIDVSTVKELARLWYPDFPLLAKREAHRTIEDLNESIANLKYYRENLFNGSR